MPPAELRDMLRRVVLDGPAAARVDGEPVVPHPGASGEAPVLEALAAAIYQSCYAGLPWPLAPDAPRGRDLGPELSAANAGRDAWAEGWAFVRLDLEGRVVAQRGGTLRALWPGHFVRADGVTGPLAPGAPLRVYQPAAPVARVQEGFWFAYGNGGPDHERRRVRVYLNVGAAGAAEVVRAYTTRLHALGVPFTLKVADREALLARRDSAVLWSEARHFRVVAEVTRAVLAGLREPLAEEAPPFTKRLAPGVGLAEDPDSGMSFGMERCGVLAEGLWLAAQEGAAGEEERLAAVGRAFDGRGLDADRPWLGAGTTRDRYEL